MFIAGIYTGSVYKDFGLLKSGFPAENIFNSSVRLGFFSMKFLLTLNISIGFSGENP